MPGLPIRAAALLLVLAAPVAAGDFDGLRVAGTRPFADMMAGPASSGIFLSPDGARLVHVASGKACLHDLAAAVPTPVACTPPGERVPGGGDLLWSPDGARLLWPLRTAAFLRFRDTDITVLDATTMAPAVLTGDGYEGSAQKGPAHFDHSARWLDPGTILFVRQEIPATGIADRGPAALLSVDLAGRTALRAAAIAPAAGFVSALDVAPGDGTVAFLVEGSGVPDAAGLHLLRPGEPGPRRILPAEALPGRPGFLAFSADGRFLALIAPGREGLTVTLVETATGRLSAVHGGRPVLGIAWSPSGAALAYLLRGGPGGAEVAGLYLAEPPDQPGRLLLAGPYMLPFCCAEPMVWARNDTLVLGNRERMDAPVLVRFER